MQPDPISCPLDLSLPCLLLVSCSSSYYPHFHCSSGFASSCLVTPRSDLLRRRRSLHPLSGRGELVWPAKINMIDQTKLHNCWWVITSDPAARSCPLDSHGNWRRAALLWKKYTIHPYCQNSKTCTSVQSRHWVYSAAEVERKLLVAYLQSCLDEGVKKKCLVNWSNQKVYKSLYVEISEALHAKDCKGKGADLCFYWLTFLTVIRFKRSLWAVDVNFISLWVDCGCFLKFLQKCVKPIRCLCECVCVCVLSQTGNLSRVYPVIVHNLHSHCKSD